jgi:limonene-1,2-epoxide hydrolase
MSPKEAPIDVVRRFCEAWSELDVDALMTFFTDDAVYHNMPIAPVTGRDAIRTTIEGFARGAERIEFRIVAAVSEGTLVFTERVDVFMMPGATVELPVAGVFELKDGRIAAWRDYFDLNQFMSQLPTAGAQG